jgi:predicted negative regulator of RcsB-dependent stress response
VLDLALSAKKGVDGNAAAITITDSQLQTIQFVLHLNLVCVFLEMQETEAMRYHLFEADSYFDTLTKSYRKQFHDHLIALRARCLFERKKYEAAWKQLDEAVDPRNLNIMRMRGRLHLHDGEYAEAETWLSRYDEGHRRICVAHHPQHLDLRLHLAEGQYHQNKVDAAFASLAEARSLVADFSLPRGAKWRNKLQPWLERTEQHGMADLANVIAAELRQTSPASETAIMVLERFRAQQILEEN